MTLLNCQGVVKVDKERFDDIERTDLKEKFPSLPTDEDKLVKELNRIENVDLIVEDDIDGGYTVVGKLSDSEFDRVKEIKDKYPEFAVGVTFMSGAKYIREEREDNSS